MSAVLAVSGVPSNAIAEVVTYTQLNKALEKAASSSLTYSWASADYMQMGTVTVEGADLSSLPDPGSGATAVATELAAGDASYDAVAAAVAKKWDGTPSTLRVYSFSIAGSDGSAAQLPEGATATVEYCDWGAGSAGLKAYSLAGGSLSELECSNGANYPTANDVIAKGADLSCVALVDSTGLTEKADAVLKAGTYTIDANLYVPADQAPIQMNAYMTNADFPPTSPKAQNGQLVVDEDGTMTVTVYPTQEIFTLQDLTSGDNVTVDKVARGGLASSYGPYSDRIVSVTCTLGDASGTYKFGSAKQYPTLLMAEQNWDVYLTVDFSSATEGSYNPDSDANSKSREFKDEATGATVTVSTGDETFGNSLPDLSLRFSVISDGDEYDSTVSQLADQYRGSYSATLYKAELLGPDGQPVSCPEDIKIVYTLPVSDSERLELWSVSEESLTQISAVKQNGSLVYQDTSLGTYAVVDYAGAYKWYSRDFVDETTGISGTFRVDGSNMGAGWVDENTSSFDFKLADGGVESKYYVRARRDCSTTADYQYELKQLVNSYVSQGMTEEEAKAKAESEMASQRYTPLNSVGEMYLNIPVDDNASAVTLVISNGEQTISVDFDATIENGYARVKLNQTFYGVKLGTESTDAGNVISWLYNGYESGFDSATASSPTAYLLVKSSDSKTVSLPSSKSYLTYDGESHELFSVPAHVEIVSGDNEATQAGDYTLTFVPEDGYSWTDGTNGEMTLTKTINRKIVYLKLDEQVAYGDQPTYEIGYTGFVGDDSAETMDWIVKPEILESSKPETLEAGQSYMLEFVSRDIKANSPNYQFVINYARVTVGEAPVKLEAGTYTVTANLAMPGEYNPVLSGTTVYANNPNNPFGIDEGTSAFPVDSTKAPVDAMSMNATLVVADDGTKTLVLPIDNPVFTTQSLGTCDELADVWVERVSSPIETKYNQSTTGAYSYGKYQTRISRMGVTLTDGLAEGTATYNFRGSTLYALPVGDISPSGKIALQLTVDYDTAKKTSDSTAVAFARSGDNGSALGALVSSGSDGKKDDTVTKVDVYRVYNPYTGEHHYTSSTLERDSLVTAGWNDEGVAWTSPSKSSDPVYRVYNPYTGDHHYTTSAAERDACVAAGWNDEGTGWYSADSSTGAKVYRGYNPYATVGIHHYTTSKVEIQNMIDAGWSDEGTGWYSLK